MKPKSEEKSQEKPEEKKPQPEGPIEFWDKQTVLSFFGGSKPLHPSTLYRGVIDGIFPKPVSITGNTSRWVASECIAAAKAMMAKRDEPKPPSKRGRPKKAAKPHEPAAVEAKLKPKKLAKRRPAQRAARS